MCVGIVVEEIANRKSPDDQGHAVDVVLAGQLVWPVGDIFLFTAEPERLFQVVALRANLGESGAGLLRFAVRKTGESQRTVEATALRQFRVEIKLPAIPQPHAKKRGSRPGLLELSTPGEAVRTDIGRAERRIALRYEGGLRMDVPVIRLGQTGWSTGRNRRIPRCVAKAVVEAEFGEMNAGIDVHAGQREAAQVIGLARQVNIVIFELGAPFATDCKFDAEACSPAGLVVPDRGDDIAGVGRVLIDVDVGVSPGETAGDIGHPFSERISGAAAQGADIIERRVERRGRKSWRVE